LHSPCHGPRRRLIGNQADDQIGWFVAGAGCPEIYNPPISATFNTGRYPTPWIILAHTAFGLPDSSSRRKNRDS
jgi:hypothetical protein